jgi:hypothetical protein
MDRMKRYWRRHRLGRGSWRTADGLVASEEVAAISGADDQRAQGGPHDRPHRLRSPWYRRVLEGELVADCQAFVLGRYAERLEGASSRVPVWAWTNLLAHGTEDDIRQAAAGGRFEPVRTRGWHAARAYLATEVLAAVDRGSSLEDLQRHVLAPLELRLSARREAASWEPRRWVAIVRSALRDYQHSQRV